VTLCDVLLPALSVVVTLNVCEPTVEVSMGLPEATGPLHVATPDPCALSWQE
jgi:hypothetical protein